MHLSAPSTAFSDSFRNTRRQFLQGGFCAAAGTLIGGSAVAQAAVAAQGSSSAWKASSGERPQPADRRFRSESIESFITATSRRIASPELRRLFANCFPNTLDTTVEPGTFEGKPDTAVITGDIAAMWLRDSSAQVWPYLRFAAQDKPLQDLLEGVIRRQARCLLIDTYANAFMADLSAPPLEWSRTDATELKQGVAERKYELDSLCYPIRLAHGFWKSTGSTAPFDNRWAAAMRAVLHTMKTQQRFEGEGPYRFQREAKNPTDTLVNGIGNPAKPNGLIASCFRPSDDACILPFFVPANLFAAVSLQQLAEMAQSILHDSAFAQQASALSGQVRSALEQHALVSTPGGTIWAYEVDGFGGQVLMDDANVPSLLGLPYLNASPDAARYARTRKFVWSEANPWFFHGSAGEGIGGPHIGRDSIWPMSQIVFALTSTSEAEVGSMLKMLVAGSAGSGFIHESYKRNDARDFTRAWFAWANTLFGELVGTTAERFPRLLA